MATAELIRVISTADSFVGGKAEALSRAQTLLEESSINGVPAQRPLHEACRVNFVDLVRLLLERRADVKTTQASTGDTALHVAAKHLSYESAVLLCEAGADVNARNAKGLAPVHVLVGEADLEVRSCRERFIDYLLGKGADIHQIDVDGRSCLHVAAEAGHVAAVKLLFKRGADGRARNHEGHTPLHMLCMSVDTRARVEAIDALLHAATVDIEAPHRHRAGEEPEDESSIPATLMDLTQAWEQPAWLRNCLRPLQLIAAVSPESDFQAAAMGLVIQARPRLDEPKGNPALHIACRANRLASASLLLKLGSAPNGKNWEGVMPLHIAARHGLVEMARLLLSHGASINAPDATAKIAVHTDSMPTRTWVVQTGNTALHWAAFSAQAGMVRMLLASDANADLRNQNGNTAVDLTINDAHVKSAFEPVTGGKAWESVLQPGSYFARNDPGCRLVPTYALTQYLQNYRPEEVPNLDVVTRHVNAGADVMAINRAGQSSLIEVMGRLSGMVMRSEAVINHVNTLVDALLAAPRVDVTMVDRLPDRSTALHTAARLDLEYCVIALLNKGADVKARNSHGHTPLTVAAMGGASRVAAVLMRAGARVAEADSDVEKLLVAPKHSTVCTRLLIEGKCNFDFRAASRAYVAHTMLLHAVHQDDEDCLKAILGLGVNADVTGAVPAELGVRRKTTALHFAVRLGRGRLLRRLIAAGASVDSADEDGETPLHEVVLRDTDSIAECRRILLERRANPNACNKSGVSPLLTCLDPTAWGDDLVHKEVIVHQLVRAGADVNARVSGGGDSAVYLALMGAGEMDLGQVQLQCAKILVDAGADVNSVDSDGNTDLMRFAARGYPKHTRMMLQWGSNCRLKNKEGDTALHLALAAKNYNEQVAELILEAGCKQDRDYPNYPNGVGRTPLHNAVVNNRTTIVAALQRAGASHTLKDHNGKSPFDLVLTAAVAADKQMEKEDQDNDEETEGMVPISINLVWLNRMDFMKGVISLVLSFLQVAAFPFALTLPWPKGYEYTVLPFQYVQLSPDFQISYQIKFWGVVGIVVVWLISFHSKRVRLYAVGSVSTWIVTDIGFIPIMRALIQSYGCTTGLDGSKATLVVEPDILCWYSSQHLTYVSTAAFLILYYLPLVVRLVRVDYQTAAIGSIYSFSACRSEHHIFQKRKWHYMMKRAHTRQLETILIFIKMLFVSVTIIGNSTGLTASRTGLLVVVSVFVFMSVLHLVVVWRFPAYVNHKVNCVHVSFASGLVAINALALVVVIFNSDAAVLPLLIMYGVVAFSLIGGFVINMFFNKASAETQEAQRQEALAAAMMSGEELARIHEDRAALARQNSDYEPEDEFEMTRASMQGSRASGFGNTGSSLGGGQGGAGGVRRPRQAPSLRVKPKAHVYEMPKRPSQVQPIRAPSPQPDLSDSEDQGSPGRLLPRRDSKVYPAAFRNIEPPVSNVTRPGMARAGTMMRIAPPTAAPAAHTEIRRMRRASTNKRDAAAEEFGPAMDDISGNDGRNSNGGGGSKFGGGFRRPSASLSGGASGPGLVRPPPGAQGGVGSAVPARVYEQRRRPSVSAWSPN